MHLRGKWLHLAKISPKSFDFLARLWYVIFIETGGVDPLDRGWKSSVLFFRSLTVSGFSPAVSIKLEPL